MCCPFLILSIRETSCITQTPSVLTTNRHLSVYWAFLILTNYLPSTVKIMKEGRERAISHNFIFLG